MNSLFTRTLLWFIATVFLTHLAIMVAAALDDDEEDDQRRSPLRTLLSLEVSEAVRAWEAGGAGELRATLERFRKNGYGERVLTDSSFHDLLSGAVRTDLAQSARTRRRFTLWRRDRTVIVRRSEDRRYSYFVVMPRGGLIRWYLQPDIQVTILSVLVVLSFAFARHLTSPVRRLQNVVDCFGRGDLRTRANSTRKDEIGQLARTFDRMADRIQVLLDAERRLLLDISHELRSPLARLSLAAELARSGGDPGPYLDRIDKEADRLNALVGELLQVTRAEGDEKRMQRETVNLEALTTAVVDDAQIEAEQRGCRIEWGTKQPVETAGDPELLRRAVENVVRNAVRYTEQGTPVIVSVTRAGETATVRVRDHGPGVPPEHLSRIFDPFYRVDPDRNRVSGGVGLGLSIARRAVELHHGQITAENVSPGLCVTITLPLYPAGTSHQQAA